MKRMIRLSVRNDPDSNKFVSFEISLTSLEVVRSFKFRIVYGRQLSVELPIMAIKPVLLRDPASYGYYPKDCGFGEGGLTFSDIKENQYESAKLLNQLETAGLGRVGLGRVGLGGAGLGGVGAGTTVKLDRFTPDLLPPLPLLPENPSTMVGVVIGSFIPPGASSGTRGEFDSS